MNGFLKVTKVFFLIFSLSLPVEAYRVRLFTTDINNRSIFCTKDAENLCGGHPHTMCIEEASANSNENLCSNQERFQILPISKSQVIYSHNGIRDSFARRYGISNMNMLHYDVDLEEMARKFVRQCAYFEGNRCNYLLTKDFEVGENRIYFPKLPPKRFMNKVVRAWYLENERAVNENYYLDIDKQDVMNLTQLIWPITELVGCGAAIIDFNYFAVCNYWPHINRNINPFKFGTRCQHCPKERQSCSIIFGNLCGLDDFNEKLRGNIIETKSFSIFISLFSFIIVHLFTV